MWCKSIGFELPRGGGRTDGRTDARRNNQLRAQPSGEMHENKFEEGASKSDREWLRVESEPGEERRERNVRQGGQSEVREWKVYGFSWEVLIFDDFTYDFSWEVLKFTISTSHFMVCFGHLTKKVSILCFVLRATVAKYCKIHKWFSEISDSMVQKHRFWASPRRGTHARMDARRNKQLRTQPSGEMHENKFK